MPKQPDSRLTPAQFEIMQIVWDAPDGATVAEIWDAVAELRDVGRTTVLNLVGRLEKRGWLRREKRGGVFRYEAAVDRDAATAQLARSVVDDFFGGSASDLVMSLLGSRRIKSDEVERLKQLLEEHSASQPKRSRARR